MPFEVQSRGIRVMADRLEALGAKGEREQTRALIDTRRRSLTFAGRDIREEYAVKAGVLRKGLTASKVANLQFILTASEKTISLKNFGRASKTKKGVTVTVNKGSRTLYDSAFFIKSLGNNIFRRKFKNKSARLGQVGRTPIEKLAGPAPSQMFAKEGRPERIGEFASSRLRAEITRRLTRVFKKG